jgi:hypothetical protein
MREQHEETDDDRLRRIGIHRVMARIASVFAVSRGLSSALFVVLIVLTDHSVAAADRYVSRHVEGSFDPLVVGLVEGLIMLAAGTACLSAAFAKNVVPPLAEWLPRVNPWHSVAIGFLLGVEGVLWAISTKEVSRFFEVGSVVIGVPLVLGIRAFSVDFHFFHVMGAVYSCLGLLAATFAADSAMSHVARADIYHLLECVVWGLFLLGVGEFFEKHKRVPILGVLLPWLFVRLAVLTVAVVFFIGFGSIHTGTFSCLLAGVQCGAGVPFALLGHSLVLLLRIAAYVVITKYIGPELCAVTAVTSSALLFYSRVGFLSTEVLGALLCCCGGAIFTHGQWMHELEKNQQWDEALRLSAAPTIMSSTESAGSRSSSEIDE